MRYKLLAGAILLAFVSAHASAETAPAQKDITRVTGIGGVFFKAKDPALLRAWYKKHLGIDVQVWGGAKFRWVDGAGHPTVLPVKLEGAGRCVHVSI